MKTFLDHVRANRFLVVGRAGLDVFVDPPGVMVEDAERFEAGLGGSAANIAAGLAKFGGRAALVTCVSDDAVGRYCLKQLDRYGVDRAHVRSVAGEARNQVAIYDHLIDGHSNVIYRNGAADFHMSLEDIARVDFSAHRVLISAGTVFAAEPSRSAAFAAFERARAAGLSIIFDIDYRPYSWTSPEDAAETLSRAGAMADVIVGNDDEFGFMAGSHAQGRAKAESLAAAGAALVIFKLGAGGAVSFADGAVVRTGIYPVEAIKPNGAGDSFLAGLLSGLMRGEGLEASVLRGSACAAMVVSRRGCAPAMPDEADLLAFLEKHPGPTEPDPAPARS